MCMGVCSMTWFTAHQVAIPDTAWHLTVNHTRHLTVAECVGVLYTGTVPGVLCLNCIMCCYVMFAAKLVMIRMNTC